MGNASTLPVALTIAGSDSGGGAGIQADLKTFQSFGVFGTTAITAITVQDTTGVRGVHPVPPEFVRAQIDAVAEDLGPAAVKSGMLATAALVRTVATAIEDHRMVRYVLDPVLVSSTGARLLDPDAVGSISARLLPLAALVTPNLDEARVLTELEVLGVEGQREAARRLVQMGARAALVKGGHSPGTEVADLFWDGTTERIWRRPKLPTRNTHGTGCTLSAGIAAGLAWGIPLENAIERALTYVERAIRTAPGLGSGVGPINHFAEVPD
ncbi:MAG: bifunctional hydroxymethylpyrimidine kinase/phosphomethylpyrimidine kinase [Gemmatimonadetes bacterium]|nr:bifunctional hydroxymethylpyrimidine kinase/phosphomethylpyrimidine kinase [Gemmatimonadota bacterium]